MNVFPGKIVRPRFTQTKSDFSTTLTSRVNDYFKSNNISRYANSEMVLKTLVMLSIYIIPYFLIVLGTFPSAWYLPLLYAISGIGVAGVGFSVMHDANHSAYSKNKYINQALGYTLNLLGGNASNWKIQHNLLHHSYTNINGHDDDIRPRVILRFSPHAKKYPIHKYQYIYAWFLYGLMTLSWITIKDIMQLKEYSKMGMVKKLKISGPRVWSWVIFTKIFYYGYAIAIPILFAPYLWWQILLGFLFMHFVAGFILGIIFQPAHVVETSEYPIPEENGDVHNNWAVHQLYTTANFGNKNKVLSWYAGGLNFQIEHHLFPNVCHVHYRKISSIVKKTAIEFNLPYYNMPTFIDALVAHGKMLWKLGRV